MVNQDYKALRRLALNYAYGRGMRDEELREDFAQEYCLAIFEGKHRDLKIQYCNFCRKYFGRNDKFATRKDLERSLSFQNSIPIEYVAKNLSHDDDTLLRMIEKEELEETIARLFKYFPQEGLVVRLILEGLSQSEIGLRMDICQSRVSQLFSLVCIRLRRKFGRESDRGK